MSTNRQDWEFEYQIGAVQSASEARAKYHRSRVEFWLEKFDEVRKSLPETISIDGATEMMMASSMSNSTYGTPRLRLDPELERKFHTATSKVGEHRKHAESYERWIIVLSGEVATRAMKLKMADVEFFSLHDTALSRLMDDDEKGA